MNEKEQKICHALWEECEPICRSICISKFQNYPSEVNDVVSELFLALCQKIDEDGLPEKTKNWIYGTLNNLINAKFKNLYKDRKYCVSMNDDNFTLPLVEFTVPVVIKFISDDFYDYFINLNFCLEHLSPYTSD